MNPYLVLGVSLQADDHTIRQAYLAAIKESPPDTHAARFQAVHQAYEQIKDETSRQKYYLFNQECPGASPLDAFLQNARLKARPCPLPLDFMKTYLRQCAS
jgi:DnaJ-class molecular chaperone